ncbi:MAG: RDD family protein [Candidatus Omnitrophica bacterium]|nr:RDD family protein [Candidatus Omnitrophota bacterium]
MADVIGEGAGGLVLASKGKRVLSDIIDLLLIPILIGFGAALVLFEANELTRNAVLAVINALWMLFRDFVFSPGRKITGLKLVNLATGGKVTLGQAVIRNILLIIPFILVIGFILETIMILAKGERLEDSWAKTRVVSA